jgi:uncharacterized membrane protein
MSENNPFLVPDPKEPQSPTGSATGRAVEAGQGVEWLREGWQLFLKNPGVWIAIAVIALVIFLVLGFIPMIGQLAANLLAPVIGAGMLIGCRALVRGDELKVEHLFAGFRHNTGNLVLLGVFAMVAAFAMGAVSLVIVGGSAATGVVMGDVAGAGMALGGLLLASLVVLALSVPLAMALWFAPALVVFRAMAPIDAVKASFNACLKNMVPFLVYGIIMLVLSFVAALPLFLGFVVLIPVIAGSIYAAYVDIFEND